MNLEEARASALRQRGAALRMLLGTVLSCGALLLIGLFDGDPPVYPEGLRIVLAILTAAAAFVAAGLYWFSQQSIKAIEHRETDQGGERG